MLHEWFMHFGGIALLLGIAAYFIVRQVTSNPRTGEDRGGAAVGTLFVGCAASAVLVISFIGVLLGFTATIPGWIGCALAGAALALASRT
jgi:hypothetical protein